MKRRSVLATLGSGTVTALAGCTHLPFSDSSDSPSNSSSDDSDLDGVPDEDDYAPWDAEVQNKSDVLDNYWGRSVTPNANSDPVTSLFSRTAPSSGRNITPSVDSAPSGMSSITSYSQQSVSLRVRSEDRPLSPHRVLIVAREFPRRGVVTHGVSDVVEGSGDVEVTVEVTSSVRDPETPLYYAAYLIPDDDVTALDATDLVYLHETNPFRVENGEFVSVTTGRELDGVSGEQYARQPVEGGYIIRLSGRTNGSDWDVVYFVSRAAYERKRMEPRGRSREEYARYALSNGSGTTFINIIRDAARRAGFSTRREQADFAIDVVQSLPYVLDDVGTGFDDYPKFIEETLTDVRGDCEDSTIALAVLLAGLGFDVVLVEFKSHIGVGIAGNFSGSYVVYNGVQYYYIETTSEGWAIGDLPKNLDTSDVKISAV